METILKQHYRRLKVAKLITDYKSCPICTFSERREISKAPYKDLYLEAIARELSLSCDEVLELFKVYECGNCQSIYADPWLSVTGMNRVYSYARSQHIGGWYSFYRWIREPQNSVFSIQRAGLWRYLSAVAGKAEFYAEVNCPFQGLLLHFKDQELTGKDKMEHAAKHVSRIQREHTNPFNAHGLLNSVYWKLLKVYWKLSRAYRKLFIKNIISNQRERRYRERFDLTNINHFSNRKIRKAMSYRRFASKPNELNSTNIHTKAPVAKHRYLLLETSPSYWGSGCVSMGCSCQSTCIGTLDTPVLSFNEAEREGLSFDVVSFFNCLDHFINPLEILERALNISQLVFISVHQSSDAHNYYRQHQFAFDRNFLDRVADKKWIHVDVSDAVRLQGQNCYLISKSLNVKALAKQHERLLVPADTMVYGGY